MESKKAFPNTPAIANAGRRQQQGSACFVLPIADSLVDGPDAIMTTLSNAVAVHKSGGGTGFSFGNLRPKGALVKSTDRDAPGPVEFLRLYSEAIGRITQAGMRPGANMGILPVDHPDIMEFIHCKREEGTITNFNISVALTDDFMQNGGFKSSIWKEIVHGAWRNGEPGAIFIDTINNTALHPEIIEATNPCGEVPLLPYEACVLGSINLSAHISGGVLELDELRRSTATLTRLLDRIIGRQDYPLAIIDRTHKRYRKVGVGVMGYADALIKCGIIYGSDDALDFAERAMRVIQDASYEESEKLGKEEGNYGTDEALRNARLPARRNLMCQVIAPTGTISRLAECSFGIEPNFARAYDSFVVGGQFRDIHPLAESPYFVEARDVSPEQHVLTQAAFQRYCDQAVSKTVNLPYEATEQDVDNIFRLAYSSGCKGITVLRENSRNDVVISTDCASGVCAL
jgi:ribonucleoside-diphosphate reductase alpha chain